MVTSVSIKFASFDSSNRQQLSSASTQSNSHSNAQLTCKRNSSSDCTAQTQQRIFSLTSLPRAAEVRQTAPHPLLQRRIFKISAPTLLIIMPSSPHAALYNPNHIRM